jgi:hypothetical protein
MQHSTHNHTPTHHNHHHHNTHTHRRTALDGPSQEQPENNTRTSGCPLRTQQCAKPYISFEFVCMFHPATPTSTHLPKQETWPAVNGCGI